MVRADIDDDDPACQESHASLRIRSEGLTVEQMTDLLGLAPSPRRPVPKPRKPRPWHAWGLSSHGEVVSSDCRRHVDWILDCGTRHAQALADLKQVGAVLDIACFWLARPCEGGPALPARQMRRLAALQVDYLWWDLYREDDCLRAGFVHEIGERILLIVGSPEAFSTVADRLRSGRSQQIFGRDVTLRLDRTGTDSVLSRAVPDIDGLHWGMRPDDMTRIADQFAALAETGPSRRLELVPERNEAGVRIVASSGEYDWRNAPFDQD